MKTVLPLKMLAKTLAMGLMISGIAYAAPDCADTDWKPSQGQTCADLGLDSNKAICESDHKFATLCDDTPTQIRTCVSDVPCTKKEKGNRKYMSGSAGEG